MEPQATPAPPTPPIPTPPTPDPIQPPVQPMPLQEQPNSKISQKLLIPSIILLVVAIILVAFKLILTKKVITPPQPTPTPLASPQPTAEAGDPTANWETYINTPFQFTFRYPNETNGLYGFFCDDLEIFALDKTPKIDSQCGPRGSYYTIQVEAANGEPIKEDELSSFEGAQSIKETIIINEITGIKATFTQVKPAPIPEKWIEILVYKNGVRYHFILSDMAFENIFDQILSTFKFSEAKSQNSENLTKEECSQQGGLWQKWGLLGQEYCQIPVSDGGKSCTDGSQCSLGYCIATNGTVPGKCQTYKATFGCIKYINNGVVDQKAFCSD